MKRIDPSKIKKCLQTRILGRRALYFKELPSTNEVARALATEAISEGTIVVSEIQTRGRGRFGREWISPKGGLWLSVILRPEVQSMHATKLTLIAAVAVAKTLSELYGLKPEIKWPNDVLVGRKKICGILTEAEFRNKTLEFAVLGIGMNANFDVEALPDDIESSATTLRSQLGKAIQRETLLCELLKNIESYYGLFAEEKFKPILDEWRRLAKFLGTYVEVRDDSETVEGLAVDIDQNGALIIRLKDQTTRTVTSGDLTFRGNEAPEYVDE